MVERRWWWLWSLPVYLGLVLLVALALHSALAPGSAPLPPPQPRAPPSHHSPSLIDLTNFTYLTSTACNATSPLLAVLVISAPWNSYNREEIRRTWGQTGEVVFLLGTNATWQAQVNREAQEYGDIVQGSFVDSYRNLTYKHIMGLMWAGKKCPRARYILKVDDDVFVNTPYLLNYLQGLSTSRLILCPVMQRSLVKRSYRSKWRVSPVEYPERWYPPYCAGWVILYSADVTQTLFAEAQIAPYFWIDDVHVTGTLARKANLTQTNLADLALWEEDAEQLVSSGNQRSDFLFALTKPWHFQTFWNMVNSVATEGSLL